MRLHALFSSRSRSSLWRAAAACRELKPAAGKSLPVKPLMARTTPTADELLTPPTNARPDRVDELMKRSEPRKPDPFDLPPPTGGAAPALPAGTDPPSRSRTRPGRSRRNEQRASARRFSRSPGSAPACCPRPRRIPKEMLTIVDRPLIQYAVDEAREAGIEQMIFVTGRGKSSLVDYFDMAFELEATMRDKGKSLDALDAVARASSARSSPSASSSRWASATRSGARGTSSATSRSPCCFPTS